MTISYEQQNCDSSFFEKAIKLQEDGKFDKALGYYNKQINLCPDFSEAYINRAVCFFNLNQDSNGNQSFNDAISHTKNKASTLSQIAGFYFSAKLYDTAFNIYKSILTIDSNYSEAYFKMGRCLWLKRIKILQANKVQDYALDTAFMSHLKAEIMTFYAKAIYLDSIVNNNYYNSLGRNAIADMNTNYEYYYYRAFVEMNFAEYTAALTDFEKSIKIHPTIDSYNYAAHLARKVGQKQKACEYIQMWATMFNPSEKIDLFTKHDIADKFCKELGIFKK